MDGKRDDRLITTAAMMAEWRTLLAERDRLLAIVAACQFGIYDGTCGWQERYALGRVELKFNRLARRDVAAMVDEIERHQHERQKTLDSRNGDGADGGRSGAKECP